MSSCAFPPHVLSGCSIITASRAVVKISCRHAPLGLLPRAWRSERLHLPGLGLQKVAAWGRRFPVNRAQVLLQSWCSVEGSTQGRDLGLLLQQIPRQSFFSLALGWKGLKSLCRQAVVPAESKCQPYLLGCLCAACACPIAHHCGQLWANASYEPDPTWLWEKDCITTGSTYLMAPFSSAHMILLALCYYDAYLLLFFFAFFFGK